VDFLHSKMIDLERYIEGRISKDESFIRRIEADIEKRKDIAPSDYIKYIIIARKMYETELIRKNDIIDMCTQLLLIKLKKDLKEDDEKIVKSFVKKILQGEIAINNIFRLRDIESVKYCVNIGNIYGDPIFEGTTQIRFANQTNHKEIKNIIEYLERIDTNGTAEITNMSARIYRILGYKRAENLLSGRYGPVDINVIQSMFRKEFYDMGLSSDDKYRPILNNEFLDLLFGEEGNKSGNSLINRYLTLNVVMKRIDDAKIESVNKELVSKLRFQELIIDDETKYTIEIDENLYNFLESIFGKTVRDINKEDLKEILGQMDFDKFRAGITNDNINDFVKLFLTDSTKTSEFKRCFSRRLGEYGYIFNNMNIVYNHLDILNEEYLRMIQNMSTLVLKISNVKVIGTLIKNISDLIAMRDIDFSIDPRLQEIAERSRNDRQFLVDSNVTWKQIVERSEEIFREQLKLQGKKFPNVSAERSGLQLSVIPPHSPDMQYDGYLVNRCIRPLGAADEEILPEGEGQRGKQSFLKYCATTEYAGGIEIRDKNGVLVGFSPILRNGNTLYIHGIEEAFSFDEQMRTNILELIKTWSERVIDVSRQEEGQGGISLVLISSMGQIPTTQLPQPKTRFRHFNIDGNWGNMYHNIEHLNFNPVSHHIIAGSGEFIEYPVKHTFSYPEDEVQRETFSREEISIIKAERYSQLVNRRMQLVSKGDLTEEERDELRSVSDELKKYKQVVKYAEKNARILIPKAKQIPYVGEVSDEDEVAAIRLMQGVNISKRMEVVRRQINALHKLNGCDEIDLEDVVIRSFVCGENWYIILTDDKEVISKNFNPDDAQHAKQKKIFDIEHMKMNNVANGIEISSND